MTGSRHERQPPAHTATGIAPGSHRIPSSPPLPQGRHEVMMLFGQHSIIENCPAIVNLSQKAAFRMVQAHFRPPPAKKRSGGRRRTPCPGALDSQNDADQAAAAFVDDALQCFLQLFPGILRHAFELALQVLADQLMEGPPENVALPDLAGIPANSSSR